MPEAGDGSRGSRAEQAQRLSVDTPAPPTQQGPAALMAQWRGLEQRSSKKTGLAVEGSWASGTSEAE